MSEETVTQLAEKATEQPVPGSVFDGLSAGQFASCIYIAEAVRKAYELKISFEDPNALKSVERYTILSAIDKLWQEHLYGMDSLRNSIGLRAYGQRDPLIEYKAEAFKMFEELMVNVKSEICSNIFRSASSLLAFEKFLHGMRTQAIHPEAPTYGTGEPPKGTTDSDSSVVSEAAEAIEKAKPMRAGPKVGRNDPCPCGSGKKFKQCCGK